MHLKAISKHLQIYADCNGDQVLIRNREADHIFQSLMIKKSDVKTIRILPSQVEEEETDDSKTEN